MNESQFEDILYNPELSVVETRIETADTHTTTLTVNGIIAAVRTITASGTVYQ